MDDNQNIFFKKKNMVELVIIQMHHFILDSQIMTEEISDEHIGFCTYELLDCWII